MDGWDTLAHAIATEALYALKWGDRYEANHASRFWRTNMLMREGD